MSNPQIDVLEECRKRFGPEPRKFSWLTRKGYLTIPKPGFLAANPEHGLNRLFEGLPALFENGVITWGHVVQANTLLYQDNQHNCPADIVFSTDERKSPNPSQLERMAFNLAHLKGTQPEEPDCVPIARHLTDEMTPAFGLPVPLTQSQGFSCVLSTTFIDRRHLHKRRLSRNIFPIVCHRQKPHFAMVLPSHYWPRGFLTWWQT